MDLQIYLHAKKIIASLTEDLHNVRDRHNAKVLQNLGVVQIQDALETYTYISIICKKFYAMKFLKKNFYEVNCSTGSIACCVTHLYVRKFIQLSCQSMQQDS